ncbi:MAG: hypothetical protein II751_00995, partial [Bacteroidales bacterium]|nr:hypothetical protein [Bacteroidales bacterium]
TIFARQKTHDMTTYSHTYSITAADMDKDYRLMPSAVVLYVQDAWARMMSTLGMAAFDLIKENKIWIITEFNAHFEPVETFWSEAVETTVWNSETSPLRIYSDFRITKAGTGQLIAQGYACWSILDADTKRLARTDAMQQSLPLVEDLALGPHKKLRFPATGDLLKQADHHTNSLDLDFNGHVNNRSYLNIALLTVPDTFLSHNAPAHLSIHWLHETFENETLRCLLFAVPDTQGAFLHRIEKEDGTPAVEIYSEWRPATHYTPVAETLHRT